MRKLGYEQREESLIGLALAENVVFRLSRRQRNARIRWLSKVVPSIAAALGANIDEAAVLLSEHAHEQLRELGEPQADLSV